MDENEVIPNDQATYNENVYWKKQISILGMRFESPKQLKHMMCNYVVANGYQLCYTISIVGDFQLNVVLGSTSLECRLLG